MQELEKREERLLLPLQRPKRAPTLTGLQGRKPLNEKEKIIADRKYVEKLINDPSTRPSETINRANHTYSILYIIDEERIFVHGVWMIKGDTFYYMELISDGEVEAWRIEWADRWGHPMVKKTIEVWNEGYS